MLYRYIKKRIPINRYTLFSYMLIRFSLLYQPLLEAGHLVGNFLVLVEPV